MFRLTPSYDRAFSVFIRGRRDAAATSPCAASSNMPFGSPLCLSFETFAAERIGRVLVDARELQRRTVRDRAVSVCAPENHGLLGATLSRSQRVGNTRRLPVRFDPAASGHPFAGFRLVTRAFTFARKSSRLVVPSRFNVISR
jgi:hypothetical protein